MDLSNSDLDYIIPKGTSHTLVPNTTYEVKKIKINSYKVSCSLFSCRHAHCKKLCYEQNKFVSGYKVSLTQHFGVASIALKMM